MGSPRRELPTPGASGLQESPQGPAEAPEGGRTVLTLIAVLLMVAGVLLIAAALAPPDP